MHGGTGLTDDQYQEVIAAGISKINIATVIVNSATERMIKAANEEKASMFSISEAVKQAFREWSLHFYEVFGTTGKAEMEK
jgi:fructose-bisphosphate aldolase class II